MVLLPQEQCSNVFLWIIQIPIWPKIDTGITNEILIQHYGKIKAKKRKLKIALL